MIQRTVRVALLAWGLVACASQPAAPPETPPVTVDDAPDAPAAPALVPPPVPEVAQDTPAREVVPRSTVEEVLEAGMGRLLQRVQVEPARENGRFVGHRVVALDPSWRGALVEVGDVIVRLNGSTLETPDKAQRALQTLRVSSEVVVEVLRSGEARRVRLAID